MTALFFAVFAVLAVPQFSFAHCQVPCGIYDDHARVAAMLEDAATVEKSNSWENLPASRMRNHATKWCAG